MPRGRNEQVTRGMTGRETFDQSYLEDSGSEMAGEGGISGRYGAGRPRGYDTSAYGDSDRGGPRMAGSRNDYSRYEAGASRAYGGHRATGGEDYEDSLDFSDDDSLAGEPASRRVGGIRGHRVIRGENHEESFDDDSLDGESAGPPYAGTRGQRGQRLPHSRGSGSRYTDTSYNDSLTDESTDDESARRPHGVRGGVAASARCAAHSSRRRELSPHPRRAAMYPGGRSGSVDSLDSEAELGGRNPSLRQYGGQRAPGSYGRYDSGRDSDRRRY